MNRSDLKLQLSNGYRLRFDHLSSLLLNVDVHTKDARVSRLSLSNALGMSPNMVKFLTSYGTALGLIAPGSCTATELGKLVAEKDSFSNMPETLWLLHYIIASNGKYVVWNRLANELIGGQVVATDKARAYFTDLTGVFSEKSLDKHLGKEINSFFNAYASQKFSRIEYLWRVSEGKFQLNETAEIPDLCILAACYLYRDRYNPGATGLEIESLATEENAPGRIFKIEEQELRMALERLNADRIVSIESRADLDQIRLNPDRNWLDIAKLFYENRYE